MCAAVMRKSSLTLDSALPIALELERGGKGRASPSLGANVFTRQRLAGILGESGLGIERVDVRRPPLEKVDHALRAGGKVRVLHEQRRRKSRLLGARRGERPCRPPGWPAPERPCPSRSG